MEEDVLLFTKGSLISNSISMASVTCMGSRRSYGSPNRQGPRKSNFVLIMRLGICSISYSDNGRNCDDADVQETHQCFPSCCHFKVESETVADDDVSFTKLIIGLIRNNVFLSYITQFESGGIPVVNIVSFQLFSQLFG